MRRVIHRCAVTGVTVVDAEVNSENRTGSELWTRGCNLPDGVRTDDYYVGEPLPAADPRYAARAKLKKERRRQLYADSETGSVRATMPIWTLHKRPGAIDPAKHIVDSKGRLRLNKMFREMPVSDCLQVQILADTVADAPKRSSSSAMTYALLFTSPYCRGE